MNTGINNQMYSYEVIVIKQDIKNIKFYINNSIVDLKLIITFAHAFWRGGSPDSYREA